MHLRGRLTNQIAICVGRMSTPAGARRARKLLTIACHGDFDLGDLSRSLSCAAVSARRDKQVPKFRLRYCWHSNLLPEGLLISAAVSQ